MMQDNSITMPPSALITVLIIVISEWFFYNDELRNEAKIAAAVLLELSSDSRFTGEIKDAAEQAESPRQAVPLKKLPMLNSTVQSRIRNTVKAREFQIGSFRVPATPYRLTIMFAPIILFGFSLATVVQLRRLHNITGPQATQNTSLQQILNSPLFERVTRVYGEGRIRHAFAVAFIHLPLVIAAILFLPAVIMPELEEIRLYITTFGKYLPPNPPAIIVPFAKAADNAYLWVSLIVGTLACWIALTWLVTKPWYGSRPIPEEEPQLTK